MEPRQARRSPLRLFGSSEARDEVGPGEDKDDFPRTLEDLE